MNADANVSCRTPVAAVTVPHMRRTLLATALGVTTGIAGALSAQAPLPDVASAKSGSGYLTPPKVIVDILEAPPSPTATLSPKGDVLAVYDRRSMPPVAELARPMLRLAGVRLDPLTNAPHRGADTIGLALTSTTDGSSRRVTLPAGRRMLPIGVFTRWLASRGRRDRGGGHRVVGRRRRHGAGAAALGGARLNWGFDKPCAWQTDGRALVCRLVPASRGAAPTPPVVPSGPNIQETMGKPAAVRTYQDLLASAHDDALFEHYFTSQIAQVDASTGAATPIGAPGLYVDSDPSPDGRFLFVARIVRPFSRLVPYDDFPRQVAVWGRDGRSVRAIAEVPMGDAVPITGVITGPRAFAWDPTQPARFVWAEALDGGDLKNRVPQRDKVMGLEAPFTADARELLRTEFRFTKIQWTDARLMLVSEYDRPKRRRGPGLSTRRGSTPRLLWDRSTEDRYADPGAPLLRTGARTIRQTGSSIFLEGDGASPQGDRPFLDRLDLATLQTDARVPVRRAELRRGHRRPVRRGRSPADPSRDAAPIRPTTSCARVRRRLRSARADDGDGSSAATGRACRSGWSPTSAPTASSSRRRCICRRATRPGTRLPLFVWAYPREFTDAERRRPGHRLAASLHAHRRRVAPAAAHAGLRGLRRPDDADRRRWRDGQRHVRRAARRERAGGGRHGRRRGRRRPRSRRRRRPQLRRVHDRQPAGALATCSAPASRAAAPTTAR